MSTYKNAIWMIASFSDRLVLPTFVKERCAEIFRKIYYSRTNIHNSKNIVCACIYYACKEARINRQITDIALAAMENKNYCSDIFTTYQKLIKMLELEVPKNFTILEEIAHLGARLELPEVVIRDATDIYKEIRKNDRIYFAGKSPRITATILLYIAGKKHKGIREDKFCKDAGISPYILKRRVSDHLESDNFKDYKPHVVMY